MKEFNTLGLCIPEKHYMVDVSSCVESMKKMVDLGKYFTLNRARQYGKTTTLFQLEQRLNDKYIVISLDFQDIGADGFSSEERFVRIFIENIISCLKEKDKKIFSKNAKWYEKIFTTKTYDFSALSGIIKKLCNDIDTGIVLIIDEVDSASNNQVFLDFLAILRSLFLKSRRISSVNTFYSVILAGVTDVRNLKKKISDDELLKVNSPWNIADEFKIDMSFTPDGIAGMLLEYDSDFKTGMDVKAVAKEIHEYSSGYPYLVSRICQILDSKNLEEKRFKTKEQIWTVEGVREAVRILLMEDNALFDSLTGKLINSPSLLNILDRAIFSGEELVYNRLDVDMNDAIRYGFLTRNENKVQIANRIFETIVYDSILTDSLRIKNTINRRALNEKDYFIKNGKLDMEQVLSRYVVCFDDIYGEKNENFDEEEGRRRFLLFLRPIINGTGNYYIEARTRNSRRMDVVVDYKGERFVIELKIWRGNAYNERGEKQIFDYLNYYHMDKGYMLSYNFNKKKKPGITHINFQGKTLVEAVV